MIFLTPSRGFHALLLTLPLLASGPPETRKHWVFVGIYDTLWAQLSHNGTFNVTEFGTVKEADQFKAL